MPNKPPAVVAIAERTYVSSKASCVATVTVTKPGIYHLVTRTGQQIVVGHDTLYADVLAEVLFDGEMRVERSSVHWRYGDQRDEVPAEVRSQGLQQALDLINQTRAQAPNGWSTTPQEGSLRWLEDQLAQAQAVVTRCQRAIEAADAGVERAKEAGNLQRANLEEAETLVQALRIRILELLE